MSSIFFTNHNLHNIHLRNVNLFDGIVDTIRGLYGFCTYLVGLHFSPKTIALYKKCVARAIRTIDYHDLTVKVLRRFFCILNEEGMSISTVRNHLAAIKRFYKYISDTEGRCQQYSQIINMKLPKVPRKLPNFLLEEEMFQLLSGVGYNRKRAVKIKLPNRERKAV